MKLAEFNEEHKDGDAATCALVKKSDSDFLTDPSYKFKTGTEIYSNLAEYLEKRRNGQLGVRTYPESPTPALCTARTGFPVDSRGLEPRCMLVWVHDDINGRTYQAVKDETGALWPID